MMYLSCAETAQRVRAALKSAYPSTVFSVRSKTYSGGASIRVLWTDGPTAKMVEEITDALQGADFDAMVDLKSYLPPVTWPDGEIAKSGADYIFTDRTISQEAQDKVQEIISSRFRFPDPPRLVRYGVTNPGEIARIAASRLNLIGGASWDHAEEIAQALRETVQEYSEPVRDEAAHG